MGDIKIRHFRLLADYMDIYMFMQRIYEKDWRNGVPAPFLEYAFYSFSYWMDLSYTYKNRIWEDQGEIVGFCFYENPVTDIYFSLKPGYEALAPEMIAYADAHMPHPTKNFQLILFEGQAALKKAAGLAGYKQISQGCQMGYEFDRSLDFSLPAGFHFVDPQKYDMEQVSKCCCYR